MGTIYKPEQWDKSVIKKRWLRPIWDVYSRNTIVPGGRNLIATFYQKRDAEKFLTMDQDCWIGLYRLRGVDIKEAPS
jgi:hypothetical protein